MKGVFTMFYAKLKQGNEETGVLYEDFQDYISDTFSPEVETMVIIPFTVHGNNYAERRENVRGAAIDFQAADCGGLYMSDMAQIYGWFEKMGKRYGLLKQFRENAIC